MLNLTSNGLNNLAAEGITSASAIKLVEEMSNETYKMGIKDGYNTGLCIGVVGTVVAAGLINVGCHIFRQIKKNREED